MPHLKHLFSYLVLLGLMRWFIFSFIPLPGIVEFDLAFVVALIFWLRFAGPTMIFVLSKLFVSTRIFVLPMSILSTLLGWCCMCFRHYSRAVGRELWFFRSSSKFCSATSKQKKRSLYFLNFLSLDIVALGWGCLCGK